MASHPPPPDKVHQEEEEEEIQVKIKKFKRYWGFITTYSEHCFPLKIPPTMKSKQNNTSSSTSRLGGGGGGDRRRMCDYAAANYKHSSFIDEIGAYLEYHITSQKKLFHNTNVKALVIGPKGTPYHDRLFFFNLAIDCLGFYTICYLSHGDDHLQINPVIKYRFHAEFRRRGISTYQSKILHVLQSFYAKLLKEERSLPLLVNDDDDDEEEEAKNSLMDYNELKFLESCKTMLFMLSKPPTDFEDYVIEHFRKRSESILDACKAYMNGTSYVGGFSVSNNSESFKTSLQQIYPKLVNAFKKNHNNNNRTRRPWSSSPSFVKATGIKIECYYSLIYRVIFVFGPLLIPFELLRCYVMVWMWTACLVTCSLPYLDKFGYWLYFSYLHDYLNKRQQRKRKNNPRPL